MMIVGFHCVTNPLGKRLCTLPVLLLLLLLLFCCDFVVVVTVHSFIHIHIDTMR